MYFTDIEYGSLKGSYNHAVELLDSAKGSFTPNRHRVAASAQVFAAPRGITASVGPRVTRLRGGTVLRSPGNVVNLLSTNGKYVAEVTTNIASIYLKAVPNKVVMCLARKDSANHNLMVVPTMEDYLPVLGDEELTDLAEAISAVFDILVGV